ncbi:MAG: Cu(I)/Ag(I) efflux system membrane fusion protein [Bradymonadia bacterium]|jgi:Cu(I)/Ag(I) efflux system membrane fusion protein
MITALRKLVERLPTVAFVVLFSLIAYGVGRATHTASSSGGESATQSTRQDAHAAAEANAANTEYVCPMHPQIRQDDPGSCPICFMDLVPVELGRGDDRGVSLTMSESAIRLSHVRTVPVERVPLERTIRVFGRVSTSDDGAANITAWTAGRIERLYVETIGETVRRGQRLARIYSPEVVVAQETLIHARRILAEAQTAGSTGRVQAAQAAERASLIELRLLGIPNEQVEELVSDGVADETVMIHAPAGGTVVRRLANQGDHVQRGTPILELVDLEEVWIQLEVYERDLPHVGVGTHVDLQLPGADGGFVGTIAFIDPIVDPLRRVARARVVVDNSSGQFRPDMFVEGTMSEPIVDDRGRPPVSVPSTAVLWTGVRSIVYVYDQLENPPVYMPIEVELGDRIGDRQIVESGVFPGEAVVSSGAFRLDASLQIRGGASMMNPADETSGGGGHDH